MKTCGQPKINNVMRNLTLNPGETARYLYEKTKKRKRQTKRKKVNKEKRQKYSGTLLVKPVNPGETARYFFMKI